MNEDLLPDCIELPDPALQDEEEILLSIDAIMAQAGDNLSRRSDAINEVCGRIYQITDMVRRAVFVAEISRRFKISRRLINERLKTLRESDDQIAGNLGDPVGDFSGVDKTLAHKLGFFEHRNCIYFIVKDGTFRATNFIIRPLFHVYSKSDNKRLVEITNEHGYTRITDIPSKSFISVEQFQQAVYNEGNYIFFGTKGHFMKILDHISDKFPVCNELRTLGWQREGFYAFANGIYNGRWQEVDQYGITVHGKHHYFSPAFSVVYTDVREDDDEYESDRYFVWKPSPVTLGQWTRLMLDVYGEKAKIAIPFVIATVFRDLIYEKYKIFPHLFLFGEKQSGKSQLAWSLSNLFFNNMPAFNLSSGTQVGFHRRLSRVKNALCWWDEYSNEIDARRIQTLKSAYDGMGHEKGKLSRDNRTEITKVNSSSVISGQYLPTADDNALFTRSILLSFERKIYSPEEMARYDELKSLEQKGISSLIGEILQFRQAVDEGYGMTFTALMDQLKDDLGRESRPFEERLVRNFCTLLAPVKIILESTAPPELNFTFDELYALAKEKIAELSLLISSSESLSNFWMMTEYLLDNKLIESSKDFEIKSVATLRLINRKGSSEALSFSEPKMVLFMRFSRIHPLYMENHRRQFGKNGVDLVSLMHYIKHHPSYLGYLNSYRFEDSVSSCHAFDYEILNVNLDRTQRMEGENLPF